MITNNELIEAARVAKLAKTNEEIENIASDMALILSIAQAIEDVDLSGFDCAVDDEAASLRDDIVMPSLPVEAILLNATGKRDGYITGPVGGRKAQ